MSGVNKVFLLGRLGKDPEVRHSQGGSTITNFTIATSENWTKDGEKQERTEWHKVVAFGKLAEICEKYLEKGKQVHIEGKIQTRSWEDKDGNKRWSIEIIANNMQMLGGGGNGGDNKQKAEPSHASGADFSEEDIPF